MSSLAPLSAVTYAQAGFDPGAYQGNRTGEQNAAKSGSVSGQTPAFKLDLSQKTEKTPAEIQRMKRSGQIECQTCKQRTYQDGSNDPGVSFKSPGHISPESSGAVVMAHEQEHVGNEQANAKKDGGRVVSQSVRLFSAVCPECGKVYISGGETRTTTVSTPKSQTNNKSGLGNQVDIAV